MNTKQKWEEMQEDKKPTSTKIKSGRKSPYQSAILQKQSIELAKQGLSNKQIASKLNISANTITAYLKGYKVKAETLANLKARLLELSQNKNTPTAELKNISSVIWQLEHS